MTDTKLHKILKKYRRLHEKHNQEWREVSKNITDKNSYIEIGYKHALKGNVLFDEIMNEFKGFDVFNHKPL